MNNKMYYNNDKHETNEERLGRKKNKSTKISMEPVNGAVVWVPTRNCVYSYTVCVQCARCFVNILLWKFQIYIDDK